jgi:hypothetical protein
MKSYQINVINALTLIIMGLWGYFGSVSPSFTALIPVVAGIILIAVTKGMKLENKIIAHIVVTLTLIIFISLFKPLAGALARNDNGAVLRVLAMIITSTVAMIIYIKSFIDVRKNRKAA